MSGGTDHRAEIFEFLEREGLSFERLGPGEDYRVGSSARRMFRHEPVFTVPTDLLAEYLLAMSERCRDQPDPLREALSLTKIHAMEYLTTDHGAGFNATTALGFRRTGRGDVEFFVEQDEADPGSPDGDDQQRGVGRRSGCRSLITGRAARLGPATGVAHAHRSG